MTQTPYLIELTSRLTEGLRFLRDERRLRHRKFVFSQQMPDGGFRGREGHSDLYYTAFAIRSLGVLGGISVEESESIARYLKTLAWRELGSIDLLNYLHSAMAIQTFSGIDLFEGELDGWDQELLSLLEQVRTKDGGYAKSTQGAVGSTYHSFLILLTYQLLGQTVPMPNRLIQFFYDRQRDDGGFVEIDPMTRSGTNPTAAAVASLKVLGALDDEIRRDVKHFLMDVRSGDGGLQANSRIPFPDGLSTFTGMLSMLDLDYQIDDLMPPETVKAFLMNKEFGLELPTGGFRGAAWDNKADVEYTFYGLGILALLES